MKPYPPPPDTTSLLNDELVAYHAKTVASPLLTSVGAKIFEDALAVRALIGAGIPYRLFETIQASLPFSEQDWAHFLELSTKSLQRYKLEPAFYFKGFHAQRILEVTEVMQAGMAFFGSLPKLEHWLRTPAFIFDNLKPIDLLQDSYGKELVLASLHRMKHGIFI